VKALRQALADNDIQAAAQYSYRLGRALEHVRIAMFEPPAKRGQESMIRWRDDWLFVSETERGILAAIGEADAASLADVFLGAWGSPYVADDHRGKVEKALSKLNRKLPTDAQLHIRSGVTIAVG
jgi:hypothetical protein